MGTGHVRGPSVGSDLDGSLKGGLLGPGVRRPRNGATTEGGDTLEKRQLLAALTALKRGSFRFRLPEHFDGIDGKIAQAFNDAIALNERMASELERLSRGVGREGRINQRASLGDVTGAWAASIDSVNSLIADVVHPTSETARVIGAVAKGDLSRSMALEVDGRPLKGEFLRVAKTVNTMVAQLSSFASEVTRVAREVGTEGKLGGQADVKGVAGTWKDLTDSVNFMAGNLTGQVRGIAKIVTAVANGDLKRKLTLEAKGEIEALADTINGMIETLATFADQVTSVAREVGVEGKLGGQARVPGAAGTWKDLTDNVNQLAANLTTQVRAIAEVATAVTKGDLTRSITVDARGEVAALKDNINEMIRNLKDTTQKNAEQDWLKTNLAKFSRMLQGQRDLLTVGKLILSELAPLVGAQHGLLYTLDGQEDEPSLQLLASYAYRERPEVPTRFHLGEGLVGQCGLEKSKILTENVPPSYVRVSSGLGEATPASIIVLPVIFETQVKAVLELASFDRFSNTHLAFLDQLTETIGIVLNTIEANSRTEDLLKQSQSLAQELQSQQKELQETNQKLEEKAALLAERNFEVERKNQEVEQARQALEEKATQLALTSKYKSEFLANMSHELRTPLNSLLILSDQLSKNPDGNLSAKQMEFAKTIHSSGNDLLTLINDILDLSKIESGTVSVDVGELRFADLREYVERTFRHVADSRALEFVITLDPDLPPALQTDSKRLLQVLKNLLSNAFKFTDKGVVGLDFAVARGGWSPDNETLNRAKSVLAISVRDTGIGISPEKHQIIFEAFQQADGSTSRKYGGTGLGLAISREIARLLGGEIKLVSNQGQGSTFTVYLPQEYTPPAVVRKAELVRPAAAPVPAVVEARPEGAVETTVLVNEIGDDRDAIQIGDRVVLLIDNDENFARFLLDLAHEHGFKAIVTARGADAIALATEYEPDAITLDIHLPDMDGWRVLDRLKNDVRTRHIPVCVISTDEEAERGLHLGVLRVVTKPIKTKEVLDEVFVTIRGYLSQPRRRLLFVAPPGAKSSELAVLLAGCGVDLVTCAGGGEALERLAGLDVQCLIADQTLGDMTGVALAETVVQHGERTPFPILIYAPSDLPEEQETTLHRLGRRWPVLRTRSPERLLDRASLFLHMALDSLPEAQGRMIKELHETDAVLAGRKVLVVDDDIRNIFALTSVLERHDIVVRSAETGEGAIQTLKNERDIDLVLMDIMMPEMDGYDTTRSIRRMPEFRELPIIAVTAKAMKGDREKTIEAGAWDYLSKPVDADQLLSVLRAWLHR